MAAKKKSKTKAGASIPPTSGRGTTPAREENGRFLPGGHASPKKAAREKTQAEIVALIRKSVETKLKKDAKATLGDYIRLVQLQKDLEDSDLREITVTWVEPKKTESDPLGE